MLAFRQRAFVPTLLFVGLVVSVISSLGAPLIPELAYDLHTSIGNAQWALTATVVVAAVSSPLVGRMGDGRHRKSVIVVCLVAVVIGGAFAAISSSLAMLILGRSLQGLGLALMPLTMAAAREHLPARRAGRAIAGLSVIGAAGVGLGYPITGLIADTFDVGTAYWFGTAFSVAALLLAAVVIPSPRPREQPAHLDVAGAILSGLGLTGLLIALEEAPEWGWGSIRTSGLLLAGCILIASWTVHELRAAHPLVDLRLMRHPAVLTANVAGLLTGLTMYLLMVVITQFVQLPSFGFGESVFVAGLTLVPLSIMSGLASRSLPWLQARVGSRVIIPAGALAIAGASLLFALTSSALWQIFLITAILGVGLGYTFAAMPGLIIGAIPREETGSAMGFYQVSRFVGFALGSGLAVTFLEGFGSGGEATLHSYRMTAAIAAAIGVITALVAWLLPGRGTAEQDRPDGITRAADADRPAPARRQAALQALRSPAGARGSAAPAAERRPA